MCSDTVLCEKSKFESFLWIKRAGKTKPLVHYWGGGLRKRGMAWSNSRENEKGESKFHLDFSGGRDPVARYVRNVESRLKWQIMLSGDKKNYIYMLWKSNRHGAVNQYVKEKNLFKICFT